MGGVVLVETHNFVILSIAICVYVTIGIVLLFCCVSIF